MTRCLSESVSMFDQKSNEESRIHERKGSFK